MWKFWGKKKLSNNKGRPLTSNTKGARFHPWSMINISYEWIMVKCVAKAVASIISYVFTRYIPVNLNEEKTGIGIYPCTIDSTYHIYHTYKYNTWFDIYVRVFEYCCTKYLTVRVKIWIGNFLCSVIEAVHLLSPKRQQRAASRGSPFSHYAIACTLHLAPCTPPLQACKCCTEEPTSCKQRIKPIVYQVYDSIEKQRVLCMHQYCTSTTIIFFNMI